MNYQSFVDNKIRYLQKPILLIYRVQYLGIIATYPRVGQLNMLRGTQTINKHLTITDKPILTYSKYLP